MISISYLIGLFGENKDKVEITCNNNTQPTFADLIRMYGLEEITSIEYGLSKCGYALLTVKTDCGLIFLIKILQNHENMMYDLIKEICSRAEDKNAGQGLLDAIHLTIVMPFKRFKALGENFTFKLNVNTIIGNGKKLSQVITYITLHDDTLEEPRVHKLQYY